MIEVLEHELASAHVAGDRDDAGADLSGELGHTVGHVTCVVLPAVLGPLLDPTVGPATEAATVDVVIGPLHRVGLGGLAVDDGDDVGTGAVGHHHHVRKRPLVRVQDRHEARHTVERGEIVGEGVVQRFDDRVESETREQCERRRILVRQGGDRRIETLEQFRRGIGLGEPAASVLPTGLESVLGLGRRARGAEVHGPRRRGVVRLAPR